MSRNPARSQTTRAVPPLIATALLLGACAAAPDWATIDRQAATLRAACERQHDNGLIPSALATEQCANPRIRALYAGAGYPQLDVLDTYLARREAIAAAIDRQSIARADGPVKLAEAQTEQNDALRQRGADPIVLDIAPAPTLPLCPRVGRKDILCN